MSHYSIINTIEVTASSIPQTRFKKDLIIGNELGEFTSQALEWPTDVDSAVSYDLTAPANYEGRRLVATIEWSTASSSTNTDVLFGIALDNHKDAAHDADTNANFGAVATTKALSTGAGETNVTQIIMSYDGLQFLTNSDNYTLRIYRLGSDSEDTLDALINVDKITIIEPDIKYGQSI